MIRSIVFALGFAVSSGAALGHAQAQPAWAFEVASIKPNQATDARGYMRVMPGGRFEAVNATAMLLLTFAYELPSEAFVEGAPDWLRTDRLDVHAKAADPNVTAAQIRLMLRSLLIERFAMVAREDRRERPVYALVQARVGNLGPKLRRVDTDCDVFWRSVQDGKTPMPGPPPPSGLVSTCLLRSAPRAGTIHSGGLTMANLAQILYPATERLVIDKTGLTGHFAFELDYQPLSAPMDSPDVPALPSVFAALDEQLGLKLTSERAPVPVVIVERVEHPTPD